MFQKQSQTGIFVAYQLFSVEIFFAIARCTFSRRIYFALAFDQKCAAVKAMHDCFGVLFLKVHHKKDSDVPTCQNAMLG